MSFFYENNYLFISHFPSIEQLRLLYLTLKSVLLANIFFIISIYSSLEHTDSIISPITFPLLSTNTVVGSTNNLPVAYSTNVLSAKH